MMDRMDMILSRRLKGKQMDIGMITKIIETVSDFCYGDANATHWSVKSSTDKDVEYLVTLAKGYYYCQCNDFVERMQPLGAACKHIYAVCHNETLNHNVLQPRQSTIELNVDDIVNEALAMYLQIKFDGKVTCITGPSYKSTEVNRYLIDIQFEECE